MQTDLTNYSPAKFNSLGTIEEADLQMRRSGALDLAVTTLGPLFARHRMCDVFGIALLHNHWLLSDDEVPIQDGSFENADKVLITRPRAKSFRRESQPSVFSIIQKSPFLLALEYSTEPCVLKANKVLDQRGVEFTRSLAEAVIEEGLQNIFGLCVIRAATRPNFELIEFNGRDRISVIRETERDAIAGKSLIETCWQFVSSTANLGCVGSCFNRCYVNAENVHYETVHTPVHSPEGDEC
jgi:hypothetical protein